MGMHVDESTVVTRAGVGRRPRGSFGLSPRLLAAAFVTFASVPGVVHAQSWSLTPLSTFGVNGWLSGTAFGASGTNSSIRSMAYNSATGNLLVANGSSLQIVNGTTGLIGSTLDSSGLSQGTRVLSSVAVMTDGVIYGANLTTSSTSTSQPFKIYRWANETATPTNFYSGDAGLPGGGRAGDSLASFGNDATGFLAFGTGTTATAPTAYFSRLPTAGGAAGTALAISGTGAANQSFRQGMAIVDSDTILGLGAGSTTNNALVTGTVAPWTLDGLRTITNANERTISNVTNVFGTSLLATIQIGSSGTNTVRIYDATNIMTANLAAPLATANIAGSNLGNTNGTVGIAFGTVDGNPVLYAMNTNNGIQAFSVVPEPTSLALAAVAAAGLGLAGLRRQGFFHARG